MKKYIFLLAAIFLIFFISFYFTLKYTSNINLDLSRINDVVMTITQADSKQAEEVVIQFDTIVHEAEESLQSNNKLLIIMLSSFCGMILITIIFILIDIDKKILKPFRKLKLFAGNIASGNFDIPLEMDSGGSFGDFTESFDLMRSELLQARESERKAYQSKQLLIASLSHDIKTPIASIKATSELMQVTLQDEKSIQRCEGINEKADQINLLISNLFNSALEELEELAVNPVEMSSITLCEIIKKADYNQLITIDRFPSCLVWGDAMRIAQVFDNIISNSYKYAGTSIAVHAEIKDNIFKISFSDYGKGVPAEDLPLILQKFFRGKNADNQSGSGLGLYISKQFMEKMKGSISCKNTLDGFSVSVNLLLV